MADDAGIKRDLLQKTQWTPQNVSYHVGRLKHAMSRQHALYVIARKHGVDLERHGVDPATLITVGELVERFAGSGSAVAPSKSEEPKSKKSREGRTSAGRRLVVRRTGLEMAIPDFAKTPADAGALRSMDAYTVIYALENTVRELIRRVLQAEYGDEWWDKAATPKIKQRAEEFMNQDRSHPWFAGRGKDPLFYVGFTEYRQLITGKHWRLFAPILDRETLVEETFNSANLVRRVVAHTAAVQRTDYDGLLVDAQRILGQIRGRENLIPG